VQPPVLVLTSDRYIDALRPFAYLLNKHWKPNPRVIVGGFTPPDFHLPTNFTFHSIGPFDQYPVGKWSNAAGRFFVEQPHEVFVLMLEDYWLTRDVDVEAVEVGYDYMRQFEYVARFDLTGDRQFAGGAKDYGQAGKVELVWSDPESQYHMSLMAGLWRRQHLLRVMRDNETPWEMELEGTPRLAALRKELIVLGTKGWPVRHTLAFRGGEPGKLLLDELSAQDLKGLRTKGLLKAWEAT